MVRHGWLVYEKYYGKGSRDANPTMASVGKAYTSIACGIMLKEKRDRIPDGLDQKVFTEKYLPEALPLDDPAKADIKLGQLLSMAAGLHGEGSNPGFVDGQPSVKLDPLSRANPPLEQDMAALRTPLWTRPGGGYCYASISPHIALIVLRHIVGMEMQQYLDERFAKPMGWGVWGWEGLYLHRRQARPHCRMPRAVAASPSIPPMPCVSLTRCSTTGDGAGSSLFRRITSPCAAGLRPIRCTPPSV